MAAGGDGRSLGRLLIERGLATEEQIRKCVSLQRERARRGDFARLGSILVEEKIVSSEQVREVLGEQRIAILVCSVCRAQFNVHDYQESQRYECRKCGGALRRPKTLESLTIQDSMKGGRRRNTPGRLPPPMVSPPAAGRGGPGPQDTIRADRKPRRRNTQSRPSDSHRIGDYEIIGEIARGGMGVIYKARQVGLDRVVALKTLNSDEAKHDDAVERFQREARAVAGLRHPNLVAVHTVDNVNGVHYFTMEFVEGIPLDALLKKSGALPADEAVRLLLPIIEALDYAHNEGVVHRDLKPANIIIDASRTPFLVDFGIAKRKGERQLTQAGEILGSVPYMAPEYIMGEDFTVACDVYSFGVVLYEALAGFEKLPFGSDNDDVETIRLLKRIAYEAPAAIREHVPGIDPGLEQIVMRAITRDLGVRYPDAGTLSKDLRAWFEAQSPAPPGSDSEESPRSPAPVPVVAPPRSSRAAKAWSLAACMALCAASGLGGWALDLRARLEAERAQKAQANPRPLLEALLSRAEALADSEPKAAEALRAAVREQCEGQPPLADLAARATPAPPGDDEGEGEEGGEPGEGQTPGEGEDAGEDAGGG